mgnify:CR=1 FL=1
MKELRILNTRDIKHLLSLLEKQFSFSGNLDYAFLQNKDDIYLISRDLAKIDTKKFNINNLGLYFGYIKNASIRLSIEGSQLIGSKCGKNILILDDEDTADWIAGEDIEISTSLKGYVLIKHKNDFIGCGYIKGGKLLNYIPKERRLRL